MSRNRMILAILIGVLALSLLYAFFTTPRQEKAPPREASRPVVKRSDKVGAKVSPADSEGRIDFAFLEQDVQSFSGAERDIFNFGKERIKVQPKPEVKKPVVVTPPVVEQVKVQPPPSVDMVNRSLSQFTFVGFLEKGGEKTVFLSSSGEMFLVKSGERFGTNQEFLVESIEGDLLRVNHPQRGTIELTLIEQQKLSSAVSAPARMEPMPTATPQTNTRFFTPKKSSIRRPGFPQGAIPEQNQENNPVEEELPEYEEPEVNEGEGSEGEINGTNQ